MSWFNRAFKKINKKTIKNASSNSHSPNQAPEVEDRPLEAKLSVNLQNLKQIFDLSSDIIYRELKIGYREPVDALLIYIDGMADKNLISATLIRPITERSVELEFNGELDRKKVFDLIYQHLATASEMRVVTDIIKLTDAILAGEVVLLLDGSPKGFIFGARGYEFRQPEEPQAEPVIRGSREGFVENYRTNTTLIRRIVKTSRLKIETMEIGVMTKTRVGLIYIRGIANDKVVEEVRQRLSRINIDGVLESGYLEEFIEDTHFTPFPQIAKTERPDRVAAGLLEGQVAILTDNTPFVLLAPVTFISFLGTAEDHYIHPLFGSSLRLLRFVTLNLTLLLPSFYIAIITFHQEMLPTRLLLSIAGSREGVPFPAFIEALIMEITFEILREAGIRLPRPVGSAVSIVGALVIGQAAVQAGLISPIVVIIVSMTAIASFTLPGLGAGFPIRLLRFPMMFLAAALGLFGIMVGELAIVIHMSCLRSFGVPYLAPLAPLVPADLKDSLVRVPRWQMRTRPRLIGWHEPLRMDPPFGEGPPSPEEKQQQAAGQKQNLAGGQQLQDALPPGSKQQESPSELGQEQNSAVGQGRRRRKPRKLGKNDA